MKKILAIVLFVGMTSCTGIGDKDDEKSITGIISSAESIPYVGEVSTGAIPIDTVYSGSHVKVKVNTDIPTQFLDDANGK